MDVINNKRLQVFMYCRITDCASYRTCGNVVELKIAITASMMVFEVTQAITNLGPAFVIQLNILGRPRRQIVIYNTLRTREKIHPYDMRRQR